MKKINKNLIYRLVILGSFLSALSSCKKDSNTTPTVIDADGNVYHTVTIGTQTWMVENLRTTKYNDGTSIPNVTDGTAWYALSTPAYCWYNNDAAANKATYGALYNWYAVNYGKLAPKGWHVPTDAEFTTLTANLGGESLAGGKLKEIGTTHWTSPNTSADNTTGFTALPGGDRYDGGAFGGVGSYGCWWSASEIYTNEAWLSVMYFDSSRVRFISFNKQKGLSVRCVKD